MPNREDGEFIKLFHKALDEYEVTVWNGGDAPSKKPLGQAIACISEDVHNAKKQLNEQNDLLSATRIRKNVTSAMSTWLDAFKKSFMVRAIVLVGISAIVINSIATKNLSAIFTWIAKLFS